MQSQNSNEKLFVRCGGYRSGLLLAVLLALAPAFSSPQAMAGDGDGDGEVWCGFDELGVEIPCGQPGGKSSANSLRDLGAMAGHLVTSHTGSLLFRPLRSTRDLIFLATNSVRDFAQGTSRDIIRFATAAAELVRHGEVPGRLATLSEPATVLCFRAADVGPPHRAVEMPREPAAYAARLYAALREADAHGPERIVIEDPPSSGGPWLAVLDRLSRATGKETLG